MREERLLDREHFDDSYANSIMKSKKFKSMDTDEQFDSMEARYVHIYPNNPKYTIYLIISISLMETFHVIFTPVITLITLSMEQYESKQRKGSAQQRDERNKRRAITQYERYYIITLDNPLFYNPDSPI